MFADQVAIVTGAASGMGREVARELARRGAVVVLADRDADGVAESARAITAAGGRAHAEQVDVADAARVQALVDGTVTRHGRLDYMFNNAGIGIAGEVRDLSLGHWRRVIEINLMGVVHGTTAAYRVMLHQGRGHIVNTASLAGLTPTPVNAPYCAAKHAVVGLSTSLRQEAAALGVKISVVCPGVIGTAIFRTSELVNLAPSLFESMPFKMMDPAAAAQAILAGVERNREYILFPLHAHILWRLHRLWPGLLAHLGRGFLARARGLRGTAQSPHEDAKTQA